MATMTAEERRAWHEQAIEDGGSVFHGGQVITSKAGLPSKGDMATTEQERYEALADLELERQALNDKEARIRSAANTVTVSDSADTSKDGKKANKAEAIEAKK